MATRRQPRMEPYRFEPALQERVEHSKFETTQELGPHDPEEAALDVDEGLLTGRKIEPDLGRAEEVEHWVPLDPELRAEAERQRRRRWALTGAATAGVGLVLLGIIDRLRRRR